MQRHVEVYVYVSMYGLLNMIVCGPVVFGKGGAEVLSVCGTEMTRAAGKNERTDNDQKSIQGHR